MPLFEVDDVRAELPRITIGPDTEPSEAQVQSIIATVEGEVRALIAGTGAPWPSDAGSEVTEASPPVIYLRATVMEGIKERVLRAAYATSVTGMEPAEIDRAAAAYRDRTATARIRAVADAILRATTPVVAGAYPTVSDRGGQAPTLSGSFADYSEARDALDAWQHRSARWPWRE